MTVHGRRVETRRGTPRLVSPGTPPWPMAWCLRISCCLPLLEGSCAVTCHSGRRAPFKAYLHPCPTLR